MLLSDTINSAEFGAMLDAHFREQDEVEMDVDITWTYPLVILRINTPEGEQFMASVDQSQTYHLGDTPLEALNNACRAQGDTCA